MGNAFLRETLCDGVHFSSVTDPKFKHNRISAVFLLPLDAATASEQAILPFLLRKGGLACPDFTRLNRRLCELYGASLCYDVSRYGGWQALDLSVYGVDDRYVGSSQMENCARLLRELIFDPNMRDGLFDEENVSQEIRQLVETIESTLNEKRSYALSRCRAAMCQGEPLAVEKYGSLDAARAITPKTSSDAYRRMMDSAQIELMVTGCGDPNPAKKIFAEAFGARPRSPITVTRTRTRVSADKVKEVTETLDVAQGKLVMGLRTGERGDPKELAAMRLMCAIYGGTPTSRLFTYVREKKSLCYYCASRFDRLTGLMFIDSGVESARRPDAQEEILRQLEVMKKGAFTDEEMTAAKLLMRTSLKSVTDSLGATEDWYMTQIMYGTQYAPIEEEEILESVSREEVVAAANKVTLDTVYFLTGRENPAQTAAETLGDPQADTGKEEG